MNPRNKQVIWLCVAVAACLTLATFSNATPEGTSDPADIDRGEAQILLTTEKNKKPAVFPHWQHQDRMACANCHDVLPEEWSKTTGHALCKDCHKAMEAPKKCSTCHPKSKVKKAYEGC